MGEVVQLKRVLRWCLGPESNRHGPFEPQDFKSYEGQRKIPFEITEDGVFPRENQPEGSRDVSPESSLLGPNWADSGGSRGKNAGMRVVR